MSDSISVDNTNSRISFSGTWAPGATFHSTNAPGASATLDFIGNIVSVVGTIPAGSGEIRVDFSVDGRVTTQTRRAGTTATANEVWFDSGYLTTYSPHRVIVTFRAGPQFQLDAIRYEGAPAPGTNNPPPTTQQPPPTTTSLPPTSSTLPPGTTTTAGGPSTTSSESSSSTSSSSSSSSSTTSGSTSGTSSTGSDTAGFTTTQFVPSPSDVSSPGNENTRVDPGGATRSAAPTGAIAGGVVGGIAFVLLIILIAVLVRRRRKRAIALADVSLRDEFYTSNSPYGGGGGDPYAGSATGLVRQQYAAPPNYSAPPANTREYTHQPVVKGGVRRQPSIGGHSSYSDNIAGFGNANIAGPSGPQPGMHMQPQQYYPQQAIQMQPMHVQPGQGPHVVDDSSTTYSAYSGIARSEQRSPQGSYGHQPQTSVSMSDNSGRSGAVGTVATGGEAIPPPAYGAAGI